MINSIDPHRRSRATFAALLVSVGVWVVGTGTPLADEPALKQPVSFDLNDQFDNKMTLKPEFSQPVIVTVADKKGYEQLPDWIAALKKEFGSSIQFFAVADLRAVPGWLKGTVRRGFRKKIAHGVAMDWDGAAAAQMNITGDEANLLMLDKEGRVSFSIHGEASDENQATLKNAIRKAINDAGVTATGVSPFRGREAAPDSTAEAGITGACRRHDDPAVCASDEPLVG